MIIVIIKNSAKEPLNGDTPPGTNRHTRTPNRVFLMVHHVPRRNSEAFAKGFVSSPSTTRRAVEWTKGLARCQDPPVPSMRRYACIALCLLFSRSHTDLTARLRKGHHPPTPRAVSTT